MLNEGANVYKLIGPVLVKQDLAEANANVRKRIEYISAELYVSSFLVNLRFFAIFLLFNMSHLVSWKYELR